MSTFKSMSNTRTLEVSSYRGNLNIITNDAESGQRRGIVIDKDNAPALALAILEAAGHRPVAYDPERLSGDDLLAYIAHRLAVHVSGEAKRAKEAADREGLEAEAWELFRVWNPFTKYGGLTSLPDFLRAEWVAVALKAREIHKAVS